LDCGEDRRFGFFFCKAGSDPKTPKAAILAALQDASPEGISIMKRLTIAVFAFCLVPALLAAGDNDAAIRTLLGRLRKGEARVVPAIAKYGAAAVPGLMEVLKEGDAAVQANAMQALGQIGPAAKAAVPILAEGLTETTNEGLAEQAAQALGHIGEPAVPVLRRVLENGPPQRAAMAARAIVHVGPAARDVEPLLIKQLQAAKDERAEVVFIEALVGLGPAAKAAVPALLEVAKAHPGKAPEIHVLVGLGKIGPAAQEAVPYLAGVLTDTKRPPNLRVHALQSLSEVAPSDKTLTEALPAMIEDAKWPRAVVVAALARTGPVNPAARTVLEEGISSKDALTRVYAAQGLGKGNPKDRAVVSVLIEALRDKEVQVRRHAAIAIGEVRPSDPAVARSLEKAAGDPDPRVREAAATALKRLEKK
jgi:HEAT repeat protein